MFTGFPTVVSSMEYAKTLVPTPIKRSVSSVQSAIAQRILPPAEPRPYRVCTQSRLRTSVLVATSLTDLLKKSARSFLMTYQLMTLVLEEDGTVVDSEAFFHSLPPNTLFMVLEKGEEWTHNPQALSSFRKPKRNEIAKLSFDMYKLNPQDFLGCLTVKATLYEIYSLSYDIKCSGFKHIFKSSLRCMMQVTKAAAHILLYGSSYVLHYIGDERR
ncbi:cell death activator CIDE-A [Astyanax mexicanus]|uniref:Cell death activator CIDE-A n=1 Tax=Astyanax mexicanus TaxID=7994 RepID=A0A8B9REJ2_ASTMX|nr:cell death activator CIDE-A [Astyanax mexicanus]